MSAKKRGHGEGTIRQLPSGRWSWVVMEGRNPDGTPHMVRLGASTRRELNDVIDNYKRAKAATPVSAVPGFIDFSNGWWCR